ncbi:pyruvate carboxylase [Schlesneria paludicola]|uniref:pyruvate carboxylase n=1 Tax=Schlesneria paludicola TaxID=360056 RepID=UPI00029AF9B4|nr:pyruvate carboxylase [Schlesneria paludicola]
MKTIKKLLVANRSEIAIRICRSAHELQIRTVAIYTHEDRYALHRFKADEAYQIGAPGEPIRAYLDIPAIIRIAKLAGVDAIHPGYGFLSENPALAAACDEAGIIFVGPTVKILESLGNKITAREIARAAGVPVLGGSSKPIADVADGQKLAEATGYPVILKAANGGGGRGMRVVLKPEDLPGLFDQAQRESMTAFGSPDIFVEKFIRQPRHIEVQLLGDKHGHLVHLFERDCSVQRRHQKVVEIAPAPFLDSKIRDAICESAIKIGRAVGYQNAGTVEFLFDTEKNDYYFIEVNPRIQVEHTVTEEVTGIDIVKSQILVAQGVPLDDPEINLGSQADIKTNGFAIQCRVTTEDPSNNFMPDYGRVSHYRSAGGAGVRLDSGSAFSGAVINPFYDSLLVKVSVRGRRFGDAAKRMERVLQEFRIRGVKTNIPFLIKVMTHPKFINGGFTTRFIDETPELFQFAPRKDRATKMLTFLADTILNTGKVHASAALKVDRSPAPLPKLDLNAPIPPGTRDKFKELGPKKFSQWVRDQKQLLITDTTMRDAHQSLLATRFRTHDLLNIADAYARLCPQLFSLEMWGGATFDTAMRFNKECPWDRLVQLRERVPNILFQMLLRASNAVGYTNYPDNIVIEFVKEAAQAGMDVFRVFDSLNWAPNMRVAMDAVCETGMLCEAAICYTGDILNPGRPKYDLKYYVNLAKELEKGGAHLLAIKDMAGLCKPAAAAKLVKTLKEEIGIPIHFHTHDTAGIQAASILFASDVGLDIADAALAPMSGGTSQPNLNTLVEAIRFSDRNPGLETEHLDSLARYWEVVRQYYQPFETVMLPATADLYQHEMPGGQYTNLYQQAKALGMADRWPEVCRVYAEVNQLFGDIVKVTPSSKSVGDMALFMVANELTSADVLNEQKDLSFPESVIDLISGKMGQPPGGFPLAVQRRILRDRPLVTGRPGESLLPADFASAAEKVRKIIKREPTNRDVVTWLLYPKVYEEFSEHQLVNSDTSCLPTPVFFYGQAPGEEISFDIEPGKRLIVKFLSISDPHPDGKRTVFFELNGQPRDVTVVDKSLEPKASANIKADSANPKHVGASMPGMISTIAVQAGDSVTKGQKLLSLEAMKMETNLTADRDGKIAQVLVKRGTQVAAGDLLMTME